MARTILGGLVAATVFVAASTSVMRSVRANVPLKKVFEERYFYDGSAMKKAYQTSSCKFCHVGDSERERTAYGKAIQKSLRKLLTREEVRSFKLRLRDENSDLYKKLDEKVRKAFELVEKEHSDPKDASSPTFGELLEGGKLPKSPPCGE